MLENHKQTVHVKSSLYRSLLGQGAGGGLGRLLQDGFTSQVLGQTAVGSPHCELPVYAHLDHLLLPGDGDVPRGKLVEKLCVLVFQVHAFNCGEGPNVVDVLGINCLGVWHKGGRQNPFGETTQEKQISASALSFICLFILLLVENPPR